jgi:broad specificity phosphatase PhoE
MVKVLSAVNWGEPALDLLSHCCNLDQGKPAVMHIRHTERPLIDDMEDGHNTLSTPTGREAAREFGLGLPENRSCRLFHTNYERAKETAMEIHRGILENGGESEVMEVLPLATVRDREGYNRYVLGYQDTESEAVKLFQNWASGRISENILMSTKDFAVRGAMLTMENLGSKGASTLDVYISHDIWIAAFMFHWFGLSPPEDWIKFLDGFIVQFSEEEMTVCFRGEKTNVDYPFWWNTVGRIL